MKKIIMLVLVTVLFVSTSSVFADECIHSWVDNVYEAPTAFEEGFTYRRCSLCGVEERETIPVRSMTKSEKAAVKATKQFMKAAKKYDAKKLMKSFVTAPKGKIFVDNIYTAAFIRKLNKKAFSYELINVSVKGKTAKVKVEIEYPDASAAFFNGMSDLTTSMLNNPSLVNQSAQSSWPYLASRFAYHLKKLPYDDDGCTITLQLKKTKNGWKINKCTKQLENAINCNYRKAYNEFWSNY